MVTDPPYGVNYDPARRFRGISILRSGRVMNDDMADWSAAFKLFPGNVVYCWFGDVNWPIVARSLQEWRLRCVIVWAKPNLVMSRGDYHWQHEQCWYGVRIGCRSMRTADRTQSTLWQISASGECGHGHGTEKPIECMARPIRNHAINEIYDPFLGSGTTMIASERLGRRCFGVEIHPPYVAVALERMHIAFPGMRIVLTGD
jgi:DNA modification methylase